jgi:hypothetical protein
MKRPSAARLGWTHHEIIEGLAGGRHLRAKHGSQAHLPARPARM